MTAKSSVLHRSRRRIATSIRLSSLGRFTVAMIDRLRGSTGQAILKHALVLRRRGYLPEAVDAFRWAANLPISRRTALIELCRTLLDMADIANAKIVLDDISREWPDGWDIEELRGRIEMAVERFSDARDAFRRAISAMPDDVSRPQIFGPAVYMESLCDDTDGALAMLARSASERLGGRAAIRLRDSRQLRPDILGLLTHEVRRLAAQSTTPGRRIAAFFLDPGSTLGHAVIEPFYLANLAGAYDQVVVMGPPRANLSAAARAALAVSCAGLVYVETADPLLRLAGQVEAGVHSFGELDLILHNFHGLCRAMFEARLDRNHPAHRGRRYLELTPEARERGDEFLHHRGHLGNQPIVALHIRSENRSDRDWAADGFRNVDARRFEPAIRYLIERGMLVVRLGDPRSPLLAIESEHFIDLARADGYHSLLDPYFVRRARFMISSQSGPCAYARAFGVPNLVANSPMFYATLPERQELYAFRPCWRVFDGRRVRVDAKSWLSQGLMRFQMDAAVREAGLFFGDLEAETIVSATQEMIAWVADPERPESAAQRRFRDLCMDISTPRMDGRRDIVGGFVGYGLPEGRLSDSIVAADPSFV
jgi:putative glycosyltransferase (TIGR04372 family)